MLLKAIKYPIFQNFAITRNNGPCELSLENGDICMGDRIAPAIRTLDPM
jgi:hypothetical protein